MDLEDYDLSDLFGTAIRSEISSCALYETQSKRTKNIFLRDKLLLLSVEEDRHRRILEGLFKKLFPDQSPRLPETSPVPQLIISLDGMENLSVSEILEKASECELAARDYYLSLKNLFEEGSSTAMTLDYLASMELGHYRLLEFELNTTMMESEFDNIIQD